jgi:F-type H+-transporting ATPase subunit epsilon
MINLIITTPEKKVLEETVDEIIVTTIAGEITVLTNHVDLLTALKPGELTIKKGAKTSHFGLTGGFMEVSKNNVSILADYAVRAEDVEIAKAQQAKERAEKVMKEKTSQRDFAEAEAQLRRSLLELEIGRRRRRSNPS